MKTIHLPRTLNAINRQSVGLAVKVEEYLEPEQCALVSGPAAHLKVLIGRLYNLGLPQEITAKYKELLFVG